MTHDYGAGRRSTWAAPRYQSAPKWMTLSTGLRGLAPWRPRGRAARSGRADGAGVAGVDDAVRLPVAGAVVTGAAVVAVDPPGAR
jgi:hypothetical protein